MSGDQSLRERASEAARTALCHYRMTDGFCGGAPDCPACGELGRQVAVDVLRHIRPTLRRLLAAKGELLCVEDVLQILDEAIEQ